MTDIDIDFADRSGALDGLQYTFAVLTGERRRHPTGVYFQDIPIDPLDEMAVWDYEVAEDKGYFKIDLLHNTSYSTVRNEEHLIDLLTTEPPWEAFENRALVSQLAQIHDHFDVLQTIKPRSIEDLAVCIALVRPGKTHLIGRPRRAIDAEIWRPSGKYFFKKSHAIAYAAGIVVQLNGLIEQAQLPEPQHDPV